MTPSLKEAREMLAGCVAQADTPSGQHPFLFDTMSLVQAKSVLDGIDHARLRAYRQARIFEPSMDGYHAAMSVYAAAFGAPDGELSIVLPNGDTLQAWELTDVFRKPPSWWEAVAVEVDRLRAAGLIPKPRESCI